VSKKRGKVSARERESLRMSNERFRISAALMDGQVKICAVVSFAVKQVGHMSGANGVYFWH